jgi:ABC-type antimicrobial peptide transport system permease subunit
VAIVSQNFAHYFFGNANPIGRYLRFVDPTTKGRMQIIGVVNDTVYQNLRDPKPRMVYFPAYSFGVEDVSYFVRSYANPAAVLSSVRRLLNEIDPAIEPNLETMPQIIKDQTHQERILATLSSLLSGFALLLVSLGLYGSTAFSVTSRTGEIGIRMALGARTDQVLQMILKETGLLVVIGVACGAPLALTLTTFLKKQLYGVEPRDPVTLITAALVMIAVALAAASIPARRAANVDPMAALKYE